MNHWKLSSVFVLLIALCACSRPDQRAASENSSAGQAVAGDWVVVRFEAEPESLNPILTQTTNARYTEFGINSSQIFETLMGYDMKDWTFTLPVLAESYPEISQDHLTYTFTTRNGVKWHDGQPFTADDILFSAKIMMSPLVDSAPLRSYFGDMTNVEIVEGRKVRFTFATPNFMNAVSLGNTFYIVAKHVFDPDGILDSFTYKDIVSARGRSEPRLKKFAENFNNHPAARSPIGTGPFKFERWDTGKEIVLARNNDYWGPKPYLEKIVYRIISDNTAALSALKSGDIDFNPRLIPIQYAQQTSGQQFDSQFQKATYGIPVYYYIGWNAERPYFSDKRVRQAMTMLLDLPQIIQTLRFGLAKQGVTHFNPDSPDFNSTLKPYPYDPKKAAQLLDEAGWKDTNGDGIRDKNGVPFRFEMLASSNSTLIQLLPILKEELRKVGIDLTERQLEFTVFVENLKDHKFDAALGGWSSDLISDPYQLWHSSSASNRGSNYVSFKNPAADRLLEQARLEFDAEKRKQLYWKWQEILYDEQPYTFLFVPQESAAWAKRFQNVNWYPARPGYDLRTWYVPATSQKYTQAK